MFIARLIKKEDRKKVLFPAQYQNLPTVITTTRTMIFYVTTYYYL